MYKENRFFFKSIKSFLLIVFYSDIAFGLQPSEGILLEDQQCKNDNDCVRYSMKCSCDCGVSINKNFLSKYLKIKENNCKEYSGPFCKISCVEETICKDGYCNIEDLDKK